MRFIFPLVAALALGGLAQAATLASTDMRGTWVSVEPSGLIAWITSPFRTRIREELEFQPDGSVRMTRAVDDGPEHTYVAAKDDVKHQDDLLIIDFKTRTGKMRLVVAGWKIDSDSALFGTLYLYNDEGLFNGIPVSYRPSP